jgi:predicted AlkP superfamily pyrophosphatase or phosphodiesterase
MSNKYSSIFNAYSTISVITLLATVLISSAGFVACNGSFSEPRTDAAQMNSPKLVVGLIVDQMRPDYIYRYWDLYGEGGIKRLATEGAVFRNAYFKHLQTSTGPGYGTSMSGASPSVHGLIGNSWYVRELDRTINVIEAADGDFVGVGSLPDYDGRKWPGNMLSTTLGDELHLHTGERSRSVGISRKDRGAILPAGHLGHAYWFEGSTGNFISSSYFMDELPQWLQEFNDRNRPQEIMEKTWETLLPIEEYVQSRDDENPYEGTFSGLDSPAFPVDLSYLTEEHGASPSLINLTPFADGLLMELAVAAIEGEDLGGGPVPDILNIGLSAADAIGHRFGPASKQVQDYYLRLDRYFEEFFNYLDDRFGMENVLIYLTSDHGAVYIPQYLSDLGIPTGHDGLDTGPNSYITSELREFMEEKWGEEFLLTYNNQNLYFDHNAIGRLGLDIEQVRKDVKRFVLTLNPVGGAITADALNRSEFTEGMKARAMHTFHQKRSGDVVVWLQPQTRGGSAIGGTGHGTGWVYDTHAPLVFMGAGIRGGDIYEKAYVSDIASTIAVFLNSPFPSGNIGNPLNGYIIGDR